ncbi:hypothetical protein BT67DRAFT_12849 [Trichocladium antarcticum]|uniref:Uncharacterized protein n=1 Tax=Trichocladium antarcticum TaxID=1450529 RepID=A0AAN6ZIC4_9PEZI|nr:hypothetical protein BT67DRAFT_12849 [Trichocladium antarcticum]
MESLQMFSFGASEGKWGLSVTRLVGATTRRPTIRDIIHQDSNLAIPTPDVAATTPTSPLCTLLSARTPGSMHSCHMATGGSTSVALWTDDHHSISRTGVGSCDRGASLAMHTDGGPRACCQLEPRRVIAGEAKPAVLLHHRPPRCRWDNFDPQSSTAVPPNPP